MTAKISSQTETSATIEVLLDEAALKPFVEIAFDHLRQRVHAKGFRPGKAPNAIVERELGSAVVQNEVIEHAVESSYVAAIRDHQLPVVSQPQVKLKKFVPYTELEFEAEVELLPKVKLGDYKGIRVARPAVKVDPAEINKTIEELRRREATRIEKEVPAVLGDEMVFDFKGTKDGEPVRGASAENHTLKLGSGQFIPGFEEELVGLKPGDEKTFKVTFPKDYHEESLKGAEVQFEVKVKRVTELVLPEVNDEFAGAVGPFKNADEMRADVADRLAKSQAEQAAREYENKVLEELLKRCEVKTPEGLVQQQLDRMKQELTQNLAYSGLDMDKYLQMLNKTMEELEKEMRPEGERRVKLALVLTEVSKAEGLQVTDDELSKEISRLKQEYPDPATQAELDRPESREDLYNHLMASRVIGKLIEYAEAK
jgi:trigger factor